MDIDLRLPSGEHDKDEERDKDDKHDKDDEQQDSDNTLDNEEKTPNGDLENESTGPVADVVDGAAGVMNSSTVDMLEDKEFMSIEPLSSMEFESHGEAYSFYQEYARSEGFNTAIQNSRRSKTSREFIDAKFACSRYGTKREYDKSFNRPRSRQTKLDPDNGTSRRACAKTDCKASMHVKRRPDGKWVVHSFVKDHNHELFPAQAISEQTRKMYAAMARQFAEYKNVSGLKNDSKSPFHRSQSMVLESADAKILLEFFSQMQCSNSNFFYAVDLTEDQRIKNLFWVDGKSRHDYCNFEDVVSLDTTYIRNRYKIPLALIVGVNQHYQFMLLGCAIISDESAASYSWLMQTWLKAMGGQPPKAIITAQDKIIKSAVSEVFPGAHHFFCLWHIWGKVSEYHGDVIKGYDKFMAKFEKCVTRSWTNEDFEKRWCKLVDRCELKEDEFMQSLYEDRSQWVPMFIQDTLLAGMCTVQRADSVNAFFDKYVHKKTSVQEFVKQYELILQERYEEESRADSDTWNKSPVLKSPSPFEKSICGVYTHSVFKKFQSEVLGAVACHPKRERQEESGGAIFRVQDLDKTQDFVVTWNEVKLEISCSCRLFEYKGYLCRHALVVLQICGLSAIPSPYILKRWTKDAKSRHLTAEEVENLPSRLQRYNAICQRAMKLSEEGSMSQESCSVAIRSIEEAYGNCVTINNSSKSLMEAGTSTSNIMLGMEDDSQSRSMSMSMGKTTKKKNPSKKSKVSSHSEMMTSMAPESLQQMEKLSSRPPGMDSFYGPPQSVQGMVQLNLMAPTRDNYYGSQPSIQGLGQLNSVAPGHDGYYTPQPSLHGMGQMDFFRSTSSYGYNIREDPNVRTAQQQQQQLHEDASRHG